MSPQAPAYADLTRALPDFINLEGLAEIEDTGDEDEALSLAVLIDALNGAGVDTAACGRYLVGEDHFTDFARDEAEDLGYISAENPLTEFVDWDGWTASLRSDHIKVEITGGAFAGTWWARP